MRGLSKKGPRITFPCPPKLKEFLERLVAFAEAIQPIPGLGIAMADAPDGRRITAGASASAGVESELGNLVLVADPTAEEPGRVRVTYGLINYGEPENMSAGDRVPLRFKTSSDSSYIYARATLDRLTGQWTTRDIFQSNQKAMNATKTQAFRLIGSFSLAQGELSVASKTGGDIVMDPCEVRE